MIKDSVSLAESYGRLQVSGNFYVAKSGSFSQSVNSSSVDLVEVEKCRCYIRFYENGPYR